MEVFSTMAYGLTREDRKQLMFYNAEHLTSQEWRIIRSVFRKLFRNSKKATQAKEFKHALDNIKDYERRDIFIKYYVEKQGIVKLSMDKHYDESVVRSRLRKATREFAFVYFDNFTRLLPPIE
ncbi:hypothetical protein [Lactococcus lactis]|uniref:hypothetical protein n=1 Tax=Lactococcus lactis TaxID=1358 RepID=UPI003D118D3C